MTDDRPLTPHVPDWDAVRHRVRTEAWAGDIVQRISEDFAHWQRALAIPPAGRPSGWTHHYFCAEEATRLTFDPDSPHRHVCSDCGRVYSGDPWDAAWRTQMHNAAASQAQRAALLIRLGERTSVPALEDLTRIVHHYAATYSDYAEHGENVGTGKVMPQNLDEAVWAIALLRAVRWAGPGVSPATIADAEHLARSVAALLEPQLGMIHNIHCWILAALAECAVRSGDQELLDRVQHGPFGVEAQIGEGFRAEGLWYEVSASYHFYTVAALLSYCEAGGPTRLSTEASATLGRALDAPPVLAHADGRLPAYGDCWPDVRLDAFASHAAVAAAVLPPGSVDVGAYRKPPGDASQDPVRLWIGSLWEGGPSRPVRGPASVAALVFGPAGLTREPTRTGASPIGPSFVWPDVGIAALATDDARITLRCGPDSGWHDHRDKLAVDVELAGGWSSLDLGTSGYGSAFTDWMRSPAAHNIAVVHDERQPALDGRLDAWSSDRLSATIGWDDRTVRRTLQLTTEGWDDVTELRVATQGALAWFFHGDGEVVGVESDVQQVPRGSTPGQEKLRDVRALAISDGVTRATWDGPGAPEVEIVVPAGFRVFAARADGNPNGRPLGVLFARGNGTEARIHARFRVR